MYHETECGCGQHGQGEEQGMGHGHGAWWGHHGYPTGGRLHHSSGCDCGCHCGCGSHHGSCFAPGFGQRRFISKEEIITCLEEYLKQLRAEAAGVEERIAEFKKTGRKQD
jgi:hypothetical protein